ncbi:hypothetical protein [Parabacteroides faecis]|uniref:hypothetical protein n=1 Tax=Parabacteroides faecis TaxID=1217282 RepID=UPI003522522C
MSKTLYIFYVLVLTIIFFILNNNLEEKKEILGKENENDISYSYYCRVNMELQLSIKGNIAPNIICRNKIDTVRLSHLVQRNALLVFRHSNLHCQSCVEFVNSILDSCFFDNYDKTIILFSSDFDQIAQNYKRINKMHINMYQIEKDILSWEPEKYMNPYFFILHPDMKTSDFFMPDAKYPQLTRQYIEGIKRLICNSQ